MGGATRRVGAGLQAPCAPPRSKRAGAGRASREVRRRQPEGRGSQASPRLSARAPVSTVLLLGSVGLPGVGSNLLVLVIYLKLPRLRNPARLLLLHVSLGDLLPPVLRAALAFSFALRGSRVGSTTIGEWASATACESRIPFTNAYVIHFDIRC
ncbi:hypothetical protein Celaphus_00010890 [Cervus elaphus hippelaphus]|uniref:G-protein coupled receptors family 1 profile domain-containing protein n=1 Tax=Cervus elaphus hippelaphus TaxID=46360 RepID=A0A212CQ21_CEREH|nr:hypothetical protein Celaphus_00010890 [Cervus elaphus hippelaphus]